WCTAGFEQLVDGCRSDWHFTVALLVGEDAVFRFLAFQELMHCGQHPLADWRQLVQLVDGRHSILALVAQGDVAVRKDRRMLDQQSRHAERRGSACGVADRADTAREL